MPYWRTAVESTFKPADAFESLSEESHDLSESDEDEPQDLEIEEINGAYRQLRAATEDLARTDRSLAERVRRIRLDNAEAISRPLRLVLLTGLICLVYVVLSVRVFIQARRSRLQNKPAE